VNCISGYSASNPSTSKTLNLGENQIALVGFNISGGGRSNQLLKSIESFKFNLTSNNPETEKFPLAVDILNDGKDEWMAYVPSDNFAGENRGCFENPTSQAFIGGMSYCEKITLSKTPEVEIGAYVQGSESGVKFDMKIKSADGLESGSCTTNEAAGNGVIERVSCIVPDFSINNEGDYFVCVKTTNPNKYLIGIEEDLPKCGFSSESGNYEGYYNYDFNIFANPKKYAPNINFTLNDDELVNAKSYVTDVKGYIRNYISDVYGDNCSRGCIIPVKIFSGVAQNIELSDASIIYITDLSTETKQFYDISEMPALINSGFQKLYLGEAGFHAPMDKGVKSFSVSLNDNVLFSEDISVGEVATIKSLTPTKTGVKYPTKFTIILNDSAISITKYMWNFGDGQMENTTKPEVTHTYNAVGDYTLKITLLDSKGKTSSKEFKITVAPASQIVPDLLSAAEINIAQIKNQIQTFSSFEQRAINYSLKLDQLESNIARLKTSASQASSEAQFETILGELLGMKIPNSLAKTAYSEGLSFYPLGNNIDLDILKKIGGGDYGNKKEKYKEAVLAWNEANINTILIYNEISAIYPNYEEPFLKTFDVTIKNKGESAYIIIKDMDDILFKEDYSQRKEGGYYYIIFDKPEEHIVFSTTENVDFINLPMFVSPGISQLTLVEWTPFTKEGGLKRWILFSIVAIIIILIVLVVWIILQFWYKRKYENYLFKNRNNLYNLVNYIQNEKNKGTSEREIIAKLRNSGWTSEQIRYAMKKYAGKRTGMPEIPVQKILKIKKNK
jgi:PKD repeat protein